MTSRLAALLIGVGLLGPGAILAQTADVRGLVVDSAGGAPLPGVEVMVSGEIAHVRAARRTNEAGRFVLSGLPLGQYDIVFNRVGYAPFTLAGAALADTGLTLRVALAARGVPLDPIVISAARTEQTSLDAPVSVSVIERGTVQAGAQFSPVEQIRTLPGVDLASKGLFQHTFEVRGPRGPVSSGLLMLVDGRYAEVPSLGVNLAYLIPSTREDIDHIELARGPAAALYGPGAPRGVLLFVTRSPFESRGGTISLTTGQRGVLQGTARYAGLLHPKLAFAVSGDYFRGHDWEWVDSIETFIRDGAINSGADPDTLLIGRRDYDIERAGGEARLDWRPAARTELTTKGGVAEAINNVDVAAGGAVQVRHWRYWFLQASMRRGRLLANAQYNEGDAGDTYQLRSGLPLVDKSRVVATQLQHGAQWNDIDLLYGADVRWTDPRTGGTVNGMNENDDRMTEAGAFLHATQTVSGRLQIVAALRVDHHSRLSDVVWSPRAGVVYKPGPTQALRLTFNRAFSSPLPSELFRDVPRVGRPIPGGFQSRTQGIPLDGYRFPRTCNGLCMHSEFNPSGPDSLLALDATLVWSEFVNSLDATVDLSGVPAPTGSQVGTTLAAWKAGRGGFQSVSPGDVRDVEPLRRETTNALELGYKAQLGGRLAIATDVWESQVHDRVVAPFAAITPNVFYDSTALRLYLTPYKGPAEAARIAALMSQRPVGTVTPIGSPYPIGVLFVQRQGQRYTLWGVDVSADWAISAKINATATYSWITYDSLSGALPGAPAVLSIPQNKGSLMLTYHDAATGLTAGVQGRAVSSFALGPGIATTYDETHMEAYSVVDVHIAYAVEAAGGASVSLDAYNAFNNLHREMVGSPALGRLVTMRVRTTF